MTVLVIAEHDNQNLKSSTLNTITAATKLNDDIHLLVLGKNIDNLITNSKSINQVTKILKCDHEKLENPIPENYGTISFQVFLKNYTHILAPASNFWKKIFFPDYRLC